MQNTAGGRAVWGMTWHRNCIPPERPFSIQQVPNQEKLMAKTVADVMKLVKENEVKFVDLRFTDTRGKEQHLSLIHI